MHLFKPGIRATSSEISPLRYRGGHQSEWPFGQAHTRAHDRRVQCRRLELLRGVEVLHSGCQLDLKRGLVALHQESSLVSGFNEKSFPRTVNWTFVEGVAQ